MDNQFYLRAMIIAIIAALFGWVGKHVIYDAKTVEQCQKDVETSEDMDKRILEQQLLLHEGFRSKRYKDTEGFVTIGIGFNLDREGARDIVEGLGLDYDNIYNGTDSITVATAKKLLQYDLDEIEDQARDAIVNYDQLSEVRQRVVCDMIFNLGHSGFKKFKNTIRNITRENFPEAYRSMLRSKWAGQVKGRAKNLATMLLRNEDVYSFKSEENVNV